MALNKKLMKVGNEVNDTANFKDDDSFKVYQTMIREMSKGPNMQVEYTPSI